MVLIQCHGLIRGNSSKPDGEDKIVDSWTLGEKLRRVERLYGNFKIPKYFWLKLEEQSQINLD